MVNDMSPRGNESAVAASKGCETKYMQLKQGRAHPQKTRHRGILVYYLSEIPLPLRLLASLSALTLHYTSNTSVRPNVVSHQNIEPSLGGASLRIPLVLIPQKQKKKDSFTLVCAEANIEAFLYQNQLGARV